ncbi:response regulator [Paenibacillus silviterrae]|uniref:response regulator n=1 Tax=Paenibacillus silviterrae TaxID=3242194 RepID=UPI002543B4A7|nr:response regulator [Paenibacillus chinjuensis]
MEPIRVLIVDDELPLRQELRSLPWEAFGAVLVGEAENGEEALELCRRLEPDLVVTDITMPVMDGLELFRRVRQRQQLTQFVLLTCHSEFAYAREALKLGALSYVIKLSFEEKEMEDAVRKAREAIQRERDHLRSERGRLRQELLHRIGPLLKGEAELSPGHQELEEALQSWFPCYPVRLTPMAGGAEAQSLLRRLEEWEGRSDNSFIYIPLSEQMLLLLLRFPGEPSSTDKYLKDFLQAIQHSCIDDISSPLRCSIDAAGPVTSREELAAELRELLAASPQSRKKIRREVLQAQEIIAARLAEPLTLTTVAEEVGLSSYYLSRLFREETGESFNDYVTRQRMERAVQLLQNTTLKIYEVAERVGIPSYRYFSQLFRSWTGVAPTEFKKG